MASTEELVTALSSHVSAAYDAVAADGGTVPVGGNLSGLAGSVATIPVIHEDIPEGYAVIEYYPSVTFSDWTVEPSEQVGVTDVDTNTLTSFLAAHPHEKCSSANFSFEQDWETGVEAWWYRGDGMDSSTWMQISPEDFAATTGISYDWVEPYGQINCTRTVTVDTTSTPQSLTLSSSTDYNGLTDTQHGYYDDDYMVNLSGTSIYVGSVKKVTIGQDATMIPTGFCRYFSRLTEVVLFKTCNITKISSDAFMCCTALNSPIIIPAKTTQVGNGFLYGCTSFNSPVTLAGNAAISYSFMHGCDSMTSTVNVGSNPIPSLTGYWLQTYLSSDTSNAPMYTTGVTLAGANAAAWKEALPDRASSPYRKLILAS